MRISVAMAVYNGSKYIKQQLDSINKQTYPVDEIVIIDDFSTENMDTIIYDFMKNTEIKVKYLKHTENKGYAKTFFEALRYTTGDYIFFSDQDDVWEDSKASKMINAICSSKALCISSLNLIVNQDCNLIRKEKQKEYIKKISMERLLRGTALRPGMSLLISSELKNKVFCYDTELFFAHDRFIEFIACINEKFFCINDNLTLYRIHSSNTSGLNISKASLRDNREGRIIQAEKEINYYDLLLKLNIDFPNKVIKIIYKYKFCFELRRKYLQTGVLRYIVIIPLICFRVSSLKVIFADILSLHKDRKYF